MWNVNPGKDKSSGGFQDRDLGKTQFDDDYGPDFGVDYARFSDPPDIQKDYLLKTLVEEQLSLHAFTEIKPTVRNGFVILKGNIFSDESRQEVSKMVKRIAGVVEVINQIQILPH